LEKRRVVITGVGLVTALGTGTEPTWKGLCEGRSGAGEITHFDATQFPARIAAEVKDFDPNHWFEKKDLKKMDSFIYYAVAATDFAMKQSGLEIGAGLAERAGVFIGSGIGGFGTI
jgi:3-oxoacyl-[acyl-carrier-protein] synthase II